MDMQPSFPEETLEEKYKHLYEITLSMKKKIQDQEREIKRLRDKFIPSGIEVDIWEIDPKAYEEPQDDSGVKGLFVWINDSWTPGKPTGPWPLNVPFDPFPVPTGEKFTELHAQINLAIRKMQFGDILWSHINNGDQSEAAELIASLIYHNRKQWMALTQ